MSVMHFMLLAAAFYALGGECMKRRPNLTEDDAFVGKKRQRISHAISYVATCPSLFNNVSDDVLREIIKCLFVITAEENPVSSRIFKLTSTLSAVSLQFYRVVRANFVPGDELDVLHRASKFISLSELIFIWQKSHSFPMSMSILTTLPLMSFVSKESSTCLFELFLELQDKVPPTETVPLCFRPCRAFFSVLFEPNNSHKSRPIDVSVTAALNLRHVFCWLLENPPGTTSADLVSIDFGSSPCVQFHHLIPDIRLLNVLRMKCRCFPPLVDDSVFYYRKLIYHVILHDNLNLLKVAFVKVNLFSPLDVIYFFLLACKEQSHNVVLFLLDLVTKASNKESLEGADLKNPEIFCLGPDLAQFLKDICVSRLFLARNDTLVRHLMQQYDAAYSFLPSSLVFFEKNLDLFKLALLRSASIKVLLNCLVFALSLNRTTFEECISDALVGPMTADLPQFGINESITTRDISLICQIYEEYVLRVSQPEQRPQLLNGLIDAVHDLLDSYECSVDFIVSACPSSPLLLDISLDGLVDACIVGSNFAFLTFIVSIVPLDHQKSIVNSLFQRFSHCICTNSNFANRFYLADELLCCLPETTEQQKNDNRELGLLKSIIGLQPKLSEFCLLFTELRHVGLLKFLLYNSSSKPAPSSTSSWWQFSKEQLTRISQLLLLTDRNSRLFKVWLTFGGLRCQSLYCHLLNTIVEQQLPKKMTKFFKHCHHSINYSMEFKISRKNCFKDLCLLAATDPQNLLVAQMLLIAGKEAVKHNLLYSLSCIISAASSPSAYTLEIFRFCLYGQFFGCLLMLLPFLDHDGTSAALDLAIESMHR